MKYILLFLTLIVCSTAFSQDIIVTSKGDVLRGTILGTDFRSVKYSVDDAAPVVAGIKDIKQFVWNGETYVIKTLFGKKKPEDLFVRIVESGKVNLYSIGGPSSVAAAAQPTVKARPTFGVGIGSGGGMGGGMGGGVGATINLGGRRSSQASAGQGGGKTVFFLEKLGTGAMQEVALSDLGRTKALLLQKMSDDEDLAGRIKALEEINGNSLMAYVRAYNAVNK